MVDLGEEEREGGGRSGEGEMERGLEGGGEGGWVGRESDGRRREGTMDDELLKPHDTHLVIALQHMAAITISSSSSSRSSTDAISDLLCSLNPEEVSAVILRICQTP